jgi:hypothetical protein
MRYFYNTSLLILLAGLGFYIASPLFAQVPSIDCEKVMTKMFDAIKQVKTLRYNLYAYERIDSKFFLANSTIKLNVSPYKAYYKNLKSGIEALLVEGQEEGDAIVNPNGFPYFNLHLDPKGKLMHKDQHQTLDRLGYAYLGSTLYHSLQQFPDAYHKYVSYVSDTTVDEALCYNIRIDFPDFHYYTYMVKGKDENVVNLAEKLYLNDYIVYSTNHLSSYESDFKAGQIITVPNAYAKYTILTIRKDINLPVYIKVYDDKGLLEEYGFTKLQVNPAIEDAEFTETFTGYHF